MTLEGSADGGGGGCCSVKAAAAAAAAARGQKLVRVLEPAASGARGPGRNERTEALRR